MALKAGRTFQDVEESLRYRLGDDLLSVEDNRGQMIVRVAPARRQDTLRALKELGFTFYVFCGGVDWPDEDRMEVLDQVYSIEHRQRLTAKYDLPRSEPKIDTGTVVYEGADWHERETWELLGIGFVGHPRLRRLLLPDWQEGHPLRKDYELEARVEKPWPGDFFSG